MTATIYELRAARIPEELAELAVHDPIVMAHLKMHLYHGLPLPEMMHRLVVALANTCADHRAQLLRLYSILPAPRVVMTAPNIQPEPPAEPAST